MRKKIPGLVSEVRAKQIGHNLNGQKYSVIAKIGKYIRNILQQMRM